MHGKPEKHVFVCTQSRPQGHPFGSCSEAKAVDILNIFNTEVIKRDLGGKVQITSTGCQGGPCSSGPTILVYPEGVKYHGVKSPEDVDAIFEEHLIGNTPVERLMVPKDMWS